MLWWIGGVLVLVVGLFFYQLLGPNPRIVVSPQTTYITEPLRADGLPDFERYVLELYREGVTPENNAAVLLWQALGPGNLEAHEQPAVASELGLRQIPDEADVVAPLYGEANRVAVAALLEARATDGRGRDEPSAEGDEQSPEDAPEAVIGPTDDIVYEVIQEAGSRPWKREQLPPLADWIAENQEQLDLLVEGSSRPHYYFPSPSLLNDSWDPLVSSVFLLHASQTRDVARILRTRAMWHLGEGRPEDAWQDLVAIHRWARLVNHGNLVEDLVAIAVNGIACSNTVTLLGHADLSAELARRIQRDLESLDYVSDMAQTYDHIERLVGVDTIVQMQMGEEYSAAEFFFDWSMNGTETFGILGLIAFDWNVVLRESNRWYDRLAATARIQDRAARRQAISQIEADLAAVEAYAYSPQQWAGGAFSPQKRSHLMAGMVVTLFVGPVRGALHAEDRARTQLDLTRLAAALAVYRAEEGEYPQALDELVPGVVDALPVDLYNAQPFIYRRTRDGYLLYSAGENGIDDGGSHQSRDIFEGRGLYGLDIEEAEREKLQRRIPAGADDISIRVPTPAFALPKLPLTRE